jgi:hypothetical protein
MKKNIKEENIAKFLQAEYEAHWQEIRTADQARYLWVRFYWTALAGASVAAWYVLGNWYVERQQDSPPLWIPLLFFSWIVAGVGLFTLAHYVLTRKKKIEAFNRINSFRRFYHSHALSLDLERWLYPKLKDSELAKPEKVQIAFMIVLGLLNSLFLAGPLFVSVSIRSGNGNIEFGLQFSVVGILLFAFGIVAQVIMWAEITGEKRNSPAS